MRRALFLVVIVIILAGSGTLTYFFSQAPGGIAIPGMRIQTENPAASALVATPEKGTLFFLFAGFVLFNLGGIATTLALLFWFLDKNVKKAKQAPNQSFSFALNAKAGSGGAVNSLGGVLSRRPAITIGIFVVLVVGAALTMALLGFFAPR